MIRAEIAALRDACRAEQLQRENDELRRALGTAKRTLETAQRRVFAPNFRNIIAMAEAALEFRAE